MGKRTEQRKHFLHCNVAGFTYWDGCLALNKMEIGTKLQLEREFDNKYDADAVAIYFDDMKLGYIPREHNESISQFLDMGHDDVFEVYVCCINKESHPEHQVHINIYIKRNEDNKTDNLEKYRK